MAEQIPTNAPSKTPEPQADAWRNDLLTLASKSGLTFKSQEFQDEQGVWWSTYHLTNPDGSTREWLGMHSGTSKKIAREHAAKQSYGNLVELIKNWVYNAHGSAAASTSQAISTYSSTATAQGHWVQELKKLAKEKQLRFECAQEQNSQGTWWVAHYLINPEDGSRSQLSCKGAADFNDAVEDAAKQAVETLQRWIATWPQPGTVAGPSGSGRSIG